MSDTILLVDDDPEMRALLRVTLAATCAIREASNGRDALRLIETERPRLVILDVNMPEMSGFEVLTAAKAVDPAVAVVMLSSEYDVAVARLALDGGARAYMTKPFDADFLRAEIGRLLDGGTESSSSRPWRVSPV
ncbi:MAG: response regulator [Elusimicrobiota bacterium]